MMECGEEYVVHYGIHLMQRWYAGNLDTPVQVCCCMVNSVVYTVSCVCGGGGGGAEGGREEVIITIIYNPLLLRSYSKN